MKALTILPLRMLFLGWWLALLVPGRSATADEIHLKNGNVIKTEGVEADENSVRYEMYGGTVKISRDMVREIVYSDTGASQSLAPSGGGENRVGTEDGKDLAARLKKKLKPGTPIEQANLCTVAVKSEIGFGSGFFINEQGYILTNRHVVRGSKKEQADFSRELDYYKNSLEEFHNVLKREAARLQKAKSNYQNDLKMIGEQKARAKRELDKQIVASMEAELAERRDKLAAWDRRYRELEEEYRAREKACSEALREQQMIQSKIAAQNTFEIILADESHLYASFVNISYTHDLALLRLNGYKTPALKKGDSVSVATGEKVYAIGNPAQLKNMVTSGVLSGRRDPYLQTNAHIYPGNSGGPLVNRKGEVIGINTMKEITYKFEGIGYAIPIETAWRDFANYLNP